MPVSKKILFPLFSIFLCYQSVKLMNYLVHSEPSSYNNLEVFLLSFLLNLFITGIFAFIGFAYPSSKVLPNKYYEIKNPKTLNSISKILLVKYFRVFLLFTFWGRGNNRKKFFNGTKRGLKNFIYQTKQSEFGHLGALIFVLISSIILLMNRYYFFVFITTLINVIGNLYPIILQRTHRRRIEIVTKYNKT